MTDTFTSDAEGLRQAALELVLEDKDSRLPDTVEIVVTDPNLLPDRIDEHGVNRGIDPKDAARELSNYHKRLAAEQQAFDQEVSDPEQLALQQSASQDELYAALDSLDVEQLRQAMVSPSVADPVKFAASQVLERRLANYDQHLRNLWDYQATQGAETMLQAQGSANSAIAFAQQMALAGLQAKYGFGSLEELQAMQTQDPQRHAAIAGEAAQIDLYLTHCANDFANRYAQEQQAAAELRRVQMAAFAAAHDEAFGKANPHLMQDPAQAKQAFEDCIAYLTGVVGLSVEQIQHLWTNEPLFRAAGTQQALYDAARYRKAMIRGSQRPVRTDLPPVQRPGSSMARVTVDEAEVTEAAANFRSNPSVRNAARLLSRRRAAAS